MPLPSLVPEPQSMKFMGDSWNMATQIAVISNKDGQQAANVLKSVLTAEWNVLLHLQEVQWPLDQAFLAMGDPDILARKTKDHSFPVPPPEIQFGTKTSSRKYFPGEEYWLAITPDCLVIWGASPRGIFYGVQTVVQLLRQVASGQVPCLVIHDWPAIEIRGVHVDLKAQYQTIEYYKSLFSHFAEWKFNCVLLELQDKFPFQKYPEVVSPNALFSPLLEELLVAADHLFLEVIPLHQAMSRLHWVLSNPAFSNLVENPGSDELELCLSNPAALALAKDLLDEICGLFPGRFVHIGGSMHRSLGTCPTCSAVVKNHPKGASYGRGQLYGTFLAAIATYVTEKNKVPIALSDGVLSVPSALDFIPARSILFHYLEFAVSRRNPVTRDDYDAEFCIRLPSSGSLDWVRVGGRKYAAPDLDAIPPELRGEFGPYLLPDSTGLFPVYPYYAYFHEKHFDVIAGPSTQCCAKTPDLPQYSLHHPNIRLHGQTAVKSGALGYITTNWIAHGASIECCIYGYAFSAEAAWHPQAIKSIFGFYRRFGIAYFGIRDERWVAIVPRLGTLFYPDRNPLWAEISAGADQILDELNHQVSRNALTFGYLRWAYSYRLFEYNLSRVLRDVENAIMSTNEGQRDPVSAGERGAFIDDLLGLIDQVAIIQDATAVLFRYTYHPAEISEELESRFSEKHDYLEQLVDLLEDYPSTHDHLVEIFTAKYAARGNFA